MYVVTAKDEPQYPLAPGGWVAEFVDEGEAKQYIADKAAACARLGFSVEWIGDGFVASLPNSEGAMDKRIVQLAARP